MTYFIEDLFKIYNSAIDAYNAKILQTINDKYTIIDKSMLASYLYIKILDELEIKEKKANDLLINYLIKQVIYSETGNLCLEIKDNSKLKVYEVVEEELIKEKFAFKNRLLKHFKYPYKEIENSEYKDLLLFCEDAAEYIILEKLRGRGNSETKKYLDKLKEKLKRTSKEIRIKKDRISKEKQKIIKLILKNKFAKSKYSKIGEVVLNLKDVSRYSCFVMSVSENVLFHHYIVTLLSIIISDYLNEELKEDVDLYAILYKSLFHDFSEYKGNEIVTQIKYYNETTIKMFLEIEEEDEKELEEKIGSSLFEYILTHKEKKEGYILDLVDKLAGILKLWIELEYKNNMNFTKAINSIYQERFKRFKDKKRLKELKNKDFLLDLLREAYVYLKENMMNKNEAILRSYYTEEEIKEFRREIEDLKENKNHFLA